MHTLNQTEDYVLLLKQVEALVESESDWIANCANVSSLIYHSLPDLNWVGFYFTQADQLILGPFQGMPACTRINLGKGVCGSAALKQITLNIEDVHTFEGHIACDSASKSECVVPIIKNGTVIGVLDVDAPIYKRFDLNLQTFLEETVKILIQKAV